MTELHSYILVSQPVQPPVPLAARSKAVGENTKGILLQKHHARAHKGRTRLLSDSPMCCHSVGCAMASRTRSVTQSDTLSIAAGHMMS